MYIGLKGTFAYKEPNKRISNDSAYPERRLYLNLLSEAENSSLKYDFKFLTKEEAEKKDEKTLWFPVGDILNFTNLSEVASFIIKNLNGHKSIDSALGIITTLYNVINDTDSISYFNTDRSSLDEVLNIFIRVNSGGTQLSYSDLLLSMASAKWGNLDAREVITKFVDDINRIGEGFKIDKDFVLKTCLVLCDFPKIAFKVDNFTPKNLETIEKSWESISKAIEISYRLLDSFGYNRDTLTSNNAVIPIAYYIYKLENPNNYYDSSKYASDRKLIFKWLTAGLLKKVFSGQPDNVLLPIRSIIKNSKGGFPLEEIIAKQRGTSKTFTFSDDDIENLFNYQYGNAYTYSILALLYPSFDFSNKFQEDHIHPKSFFTEKKLLELGVLKEDIEFYRDNYNCIANLQLLSGSQNNEKSNILFDKWILEKFPDEKERKEYMEKHYIPDCSFNIKNFREFITKRKELIFRTLKNIVD